MKKVFSALIIIVGIITIVYGTSLKTPGSLLTTYKSYDQYEDYTVIKEYVGGDAYNYIIGASLTGAKITGIMVTRAIYISAGTLICALGLLGFAFSLKEKATKKANAANTTSAYPDTKKIENASLYTTDSKENTSR